MTGAQTSEHTATYIFDSFDRRISKTVDGSTAAHLFDDDHIVAEYESGALARKFVYGPGIDEPLMMIAGENRYFLPRQRARLRPGPIECLRRSGRMPISIHHTATWPLKARSAIPTYYTGRRYDPETGLYYYRARMYSATQRRFLQPDPIGYMGGMNLYAYVGNNPFNWIDPFGLAPGDPYNSEYDAAKAAVSEVNPVSIASNREYAGVIYKNADGTYSYTPAVKGEGHDVDLPLVCPSDTILVAFYHTHGAETPEYDEEHFSNEDKVVAIVKEINAYLGTPSGYLKYFDWKNGKDGTIIGRVPTKSVRNYIIITPK